MPGDRTGWQLTADEELVAAAARTGSTADLLAARTTGDAHAVPHVRAEWLADLLSERTGHAVHPKGVDLRGARLTGPADWQDRRLTVPLVLQDCQIDGLLDLDHVDGVAVTLVRCHVPALTGRQLHLEHDLVITGCTLPGGITLLDARLDGSLTVHDSTLGSPSAAGRIAAQRPSPDAPVAAESRDARATAMQAHDQTRDMATAPAEQQDGPPPVVSAGGITVQGRLALTSCTVHGGVDLEYACVGRTMSLTGSTLQHPTTALNADCAKITGEVLLQDGFTATGQVRLQDATLGAQLNCRGGAFSCPDGFALTADSARITGNVFLGRGFTATGEVRLPGATIGGGLECDGGAFDNPGGNALTVDSAKITGHVFLDETFTATGGVRLSGATIGGVLTCSNGAFSNPDGNALTAEGTRITGSVFLNEGFTATGEVRLLGATVGGTLACTNAVFSNPDGNALAADGAKVTGDVFLDEGFTATGQVRLVGATIGGQLTCRGGAFHAPEGTALLVDSAKITGNVFLDHGFAATGAVRLTGTTIGGGLQLKDGTFSNELGEALDATGTTVSGTLTWRELRTPPRGPVDLSSSQVGVLSDDAASWPADGQLRADGFSYGALAADAVRDVEGRLAFIRLQPGFVAQPYERLIETYRADGHEREARHVAIAKQDDLRTRGELSQPQWLANRLLGITIGHGYRPGRALYVLLVLYLITVTMVFVAKDDDAFTPVRAPAAAATTETTSPSGDTAVDSRSTAGSASATGRPAASGCSSDYPCLAPFAYAAETILPIINLRQTEFWQPDATQDFAWVLRYWLWFATLAGWAGTTLAVVAFTGLARKD